ncbi:MAG: hypothetical protein M0Q49_10700 [Porticoccaceae bacterium]|nr:hypothetical protein [Porticoccaceae bacterium]
MCLFTYNMSPLVMDFEGSARIEYHIQGKRGLDMRRSIMFLSFAAAVSVAPLTSLADSATLAALQQAGVELSPELATQVEAAQGDSLANALAEVVTSLGQDGEAIRNAIRAAVSASPDLAMEITSAACLSNPGVCAIIAGAAASAAPSMAPDVAAAAAQAVPAQQDQIANTVIASVNNPSTTAAIQRAVSGSFASNQPEETASGGQPSPN